MYYNYIPIGARQRIPGHAPDHALTTPTRALVVNEWTSEDLFRSSGDPNPPPQTVCCQIKKWLKHKGEALFP